MQASASGREADARAVYGQTPRAGLLRKPLRHGAGPAFFAPFFGGGGVDALAAGVCRAALTRLLHASYTPLTRLSRLALAL